MLRLGKKFFVLSILVFPFISFANDRSGAQFRALATCAEQLKEYSKNQTGPTDPQGSQSAAQLSFSGQRDGQIGLWQIFTNSNGQKAACFHPAHSCQGEVLAATAVNGLSELEEEQRRVCELRRMSTVRAYIELFWKTGTVTRPNPPEQPITCFEPSIVDCQTQSRVSLEYRKPPSGSQVASLTLLYGAPRPMGRNEAKGAPQRSEQIDQETVRATEVWVRQLIMNAMSPEFYRARLNRADPRGTFDKLKEQLVACQSALNGLQENEQTSIRDRVNLTRFWVENLSNGNARDLNTTQNPDPRSGSLACGRAGDTSHVRPVPATPAGRRPPQPPAAR